MKFLISSIFLLALVGIVIGITVLSGGTQDVTATVRAKSVSVSVTPGTVAYGTVALSGTADTTSAQTQTAENDGTVTVDFKIIGVDTTAWKLLDTRGDNQYFHEFATDGGTAWTDMATSGTGYTTMWPGVAESATRDFDLRIGMPVTTSSYATQDVNITIQASE